MCAFGPVPWVPLPETLQRIEASLQGAGIKMWELSTVDNSACAGAPLDHGLMAMA